MMEFCLFYVLLRHDCGAERIREGIFSELRQRISEVLSSLMLLGLALNFA